MSPAERMRRHRLRKANGDPPTKRGRPRGDEAPLTGAERMRRWREKKRQQANIGA